MLSATLVMATPATAPLFEFSTGDPDGRIATGSRPSTSSTGKIEIESADDFVLSETTAITNATFTGLLTNGALLGDIGNVRVEIYRVFPSDSNVNRTSGPPDFSTPQVPTRVNSPSDDAFAERDKVSGSLSFTPSSLTANFTAANSVLNGINPIPTQNTGGEGSVTGQEVLFSVDFLTPFVLPADHYFFVPQVEVTSGEFLWLSAPKPIVPPGTPFNPDLQSWIRNENLAPGLATDRHGHSWQYHVQCGVFPDRRGYPGTLHDCAVAGWTLFVPLGKSAQMRRQAGVYPIKASQL